MTILVGDCRAVLATMPEKSVHCVVTSPPYFGLRSYLPDGHPDKALEIGSEVLHDCLGWATGTKCGECFVCVMVDVFRAVRRVLRDDGTCWVNLGDSYAGNGGAYDDSSSTLQGSKQSARMGPSRRVKRGPGLKAKDLMMIPARFALAVQADGWYLRQDVIWSKPNPLPESVKDRCAKSHEYLFLLTKSARYYFDAEAIAEPLAASSIERLSQKNLENQAGSDRQPGKTNGAMKAVRRKTFRGGGVYTSGRSHDNDAQACNDSVGNTPNEKDSRNKRSVWEIATQGYSEAHYATFPERLPELCILAGCPVNGVVLDPFLGSGTTGQVAQRLGRQWIGIDLNEANVPLATKRAVREQPGLPLGSAA